MFLADEAPHGRGTNPKRFRRFVDIEDYAVLSSVIRFHSFQLIMSSVISCS